MRQQQLVSSHFWAITYLLAFHQSVWLTTVSVFFLPPPKAPVTYGFPEPTVTYVSFAVGSLTFPQPYCLGPLFHLSHSFNTCSRSSLVTSLTLHARGNHTTKGVDDLLLLLLCPFEHKAPESWFTCLYIGAQQTNVSIPFSCSFFLNSMRFWPTGLEVGE